jgi:hypothetical protein
MSSVTPTQPTLSSPPTLAFFTPLRVTVDEYERIIASGSLNEPKKIELVDGYMVTKMSKSAEHGFSTKEVLKALERLLPPGWTAHKGDTTSYREGQQAQPLNHPVWSRIFGRLTKNFHVAIGAVCRGTCNAVPCQLTRADAPHHACSHAFVRIRGRVFTLIFSHPARQKCGNIACPFSPPSWSLH